MKKLLLFSMAIALSVATSCTEDSTDAFVESPANPTVSLVGLTDTDTGVFASNNFETQTFSVVVDANLSLYPDATGAELKSWTSSTSDFTITYSTAEEIITVTPVAANYDESAKEATITVKLNNNIGSESTSIVVSQSAPSFTNVSFEVSDGLLTPSGSTVAVSDMLIDHGSFYEDKTYSSIYVASEGKYEFVDGQYDGVLFTTADKSASFGEFYAQNDSFDYGDYWGGFALSQNFSTDEDLTNHVYNQFTAWGEAESATNSTFAVAYYNSYGGTYGVPTISFEDTTYMASVKVANTVNTYMYETSMSVDSTLYVNVVFTGLLDEVEMGSVSVALITNDSTKVENWLDVDLSSLDTINTLKISFESNDSNPVYGLNIPMYVAIDELTYIEEWK